MSGSGLKSAQEKTMWGAFDTPQYHHRYVTEAEYQNALLLSKGASTLLSMPFNGYKMIAQTGENARNSFFHWFYRQKNSHNIDNIQSLIACRQMIHDVLTKNANHRYFVPYGNAYLLEILAVHEAITQLPLMNHTRNRMAFEKIENLQGNEADISHYILTRKRKVRELQNMFSNLVVIYDKICRYIIKPLALETSGSATMYLASEYGRMVHFTMADSVSCGFHINPMYSGDASFNCYPSDVKESFALAGGCENLKLELEQDLTDYICPMEYLNKLHHEAKGYVKDHTMVTYADVEIYDKLIDKYIIEASSPFIQNNRDNTYPQERLDAESLAIAMEYFEKTKGIKYDASRLGKDNHLVQQGDTLFDILVGTTLEMMQIRQLSELAVAQATFLNYCLDLDDNRRNYIISQLFGLIEQYLLDDSKKPLNPYDSSICKDEFLVEELFFHRVLPYRFLEPIFDLNIRVRDSMQQLIKEQAQGIEKPIYHVESGTWHEATNNLPTSLNEISSNEGFKAMQEHNKSVDELVSKLILT